MILWWIGNAVLLFVVCPCSWPCSTGCWPPSSGSGPPPTTSSPAVSPSSASSTRSRTSSATTDETVHAVSVGAVRYAGSVAKLLPES